MNRDPAARDAAPDPALFEGGELGAAMRAHDWSKTPLGPLAEWPLALRAPLGICLGSSFPIAIYWGPRLALLYNDAWSPILGDKHPWALGRAAREVWPEIWNTIGPMFEQVYATGRATRSHDQLLPMHRRGFTEECWFDYTFSPIRGEDGSVEGIFNAVIETTYRHIGERRSGLLRDLGERTANAASAGEACARAAAALAADPDDLPFCLIYLRDGDAARLAGAAGLSAGAPGSEAAALDPAAWPLAEALASRDGVLLDGLTQRLGFALPGGPWPEAAERALLVPIAAGAAQQPAGVLVAGISPRLALDSEYRAFVERVAGSVGAAVGGARAMEHERAKSQALAELDRAKTTFFSNVSHELRTPLTLMLSPIDEVLARTDDAEVQQLMQLARRSGQRLQRLVSTLLDFSRIEAGRIEAAFEPVDLAACTADLASVFRSAVEKAGLGLVIDCPPLAEPVHVDRGMWEKIVFNLLSNAFKFTFEGEIRVKVRERDGHAELSVSDTGAGIPAAAQARLFERFYRVEGARGRTIEGSGIGLALVRELARLHGGDVGVQSEPGRGSRFTVRLPLGSAHLPADRLRTAGAARALPAESWLDEAQDWVRDTASVALDDALPLLPSPARSAHRSTVLVADDNADMRAYLARLLGRAHTVLAAADGVEALALARAEQPDLVLSDVMMPRMDGFALVRALRSDASTAPMPLILLSARAGDEARLEGLEAGADDYLTKPFDARELLARVDGVIALARARAALATSHAALRASEAHNRFLVELDAALHPLAEPQAILLAGARLLAGHFGVARCSYAEAEADGEHLHCTGEHAPGLPSQIGRWRIADFGAALVEACARGEPLAIDDVERDPRLAQAERAAFRGAGVRATLTVPLRREGRLVATMGLSHGLSRHWSAADVALVRAVVLRCHEAAERARAERDVAANEARFRELAEAMPQIVYVSGPGGRIEYVNRQWREYTGQSAADAENLPGVVHADDLPRLTERWQQAQRDGKPLSADFRLRRADGEYRWFLTRAMPVQDAEGRIVRWYGTSTNIDFQKRHVEALKRAHDALQQADRRKDEFLATLAHELRNPLAPLRNAVHLLQMAHNPETAGKVHAMMQRQIDHLVRLVDDLLEVSRIASGKIELQRAPVTLGAVLASAIEASRPLIDAAGHRLDLDLDIEGVSIDGDAVRLAQVFANLINNAAKYTAPGGHIVLAARYAAAEALVLVRDNGIGIAPELLPRVFELFVQAEGAGTRAQGGLGIGLSLVQSLLALHGGSVEARSEGLGHGSEFVVRLPALVGPGAALEARAETRTPRRPVPLLVLVCDDNRDAADSLGSLLEFLGASATVVYDGPAALHAAEAARPRIVLLDIGMPAMDGYAVARALRALPRGEELTLVALTGWGQARDRERTRAAGFDHHLVKPVELQALQALLASAADIVSAGQTQLEGMP